MDQLTRLDYLPFSRWHFLTVLLLGVGWLFDGYEVSSLVVSSQVLKHALHIQNQQYYLISSFYMVGCALGAWLFGMLTFFFGRKLIFIATLLMYALSILLMLVTERIQLILLSRFVAGLSVGGEYTAIQSAINELIPASYRGRVSVFIDGGWHLGSITAAIVSIYFNNIFAWKIMFAMGLFGVIPLLYFRRYIPESPRWLLTKNRQAEALFNISLIENAVRDGDFLAKPQKLEISSITNQIAARIDFRQMLQTFCNTIYRYPARFCLILVLISSQALYYTNIYYKYPIMLASKGISKEKSNNNNIAVGLYIIPLSVGSVLGYYIIGSFFDLTSRRLMCFLLCNIRSYAVFISGVFLIYLNFVNFTIWQLSLYMSVLSFFFAPAASCGAIAAGELFPSNSRSLIMATVQTINSVGGVVGIWIESPMVPGVIMIVAGCLGYIFGVDSENKTLEQIQQMY